LHSADSSPPVFSEVRVPRSLALCVCFVYRYFVLLAFVFNVTLYFFYRNMNIVDVNEANQGNKNVDF
jgi:hypothetical protein